MIKSTFKNLVLFAVGGGIYAFIEFLWKTFVSASPQHWTMFLLGGLCFIAVGAINEVIPWEMSIIKQGIIGTCIITTLEFIFGVILNIILGLDIWNYSHLPFNLFGQICLPFITIWFFLSLVAIILDDYLRWKLFNEEKPHYHLKTVCK